MVGAVAVGVCMSYMLVVQSALYVACPPYPPDRWSLDPLGPTVTHTYTHERGGGDGERM